MIARGGVAALGVLVSLACSSELIVGSDRAPAVGAGGSAGAAGAAAGSGSGASGAGTSGAPCEPAMCLGRTYRCGNCLDDDGDGAVDSDDVECTGPCDDDEDSFSLGIPGANNAPCRQDCFFDQDTGTGNDGCYASHTCDPLSIAPDYPPSGDSRCVHDPDGAIPGTSASCAELAQSQEAECLDVCLPIVPNGCDCFGCCELAGGGAFVFLGSGDADAPCTDETVADPAACRPCTPVPSCQNLCEACEVCVGGRMPGPDCGGGAVVCPTGMTACGEGLPRCPSGRYCITGCCVPEPR